MIGRFTIALLASLSLLPSSWATAQELDWSQTPYAVQIVLSTADAPAYGPRFRDEVAVDLLGRVREVFGATWEAGLVSATAGLGADFTRRDDLTWDDLPAEWLQVERPAFDLRAARPAAEGSVAAEGSEAAEGGLSADKLLFVHLDVAPDGYTVTARDYDLFTRLWSAPRSDRVAHRSVLVDAAVRTLAEAFAPTGRIEAADRETAQLVLRGAALPMGDPSLVKVAPGAVFRPVVRYNERDGSPRRIDQVEWTFLSADGIDGAQVRCALLTGVGSPLGGSRRGLTQQLAVLTVPPPAATRLTLMSRGAQPRRLSGYDVYDASPGLPDPILLGRTDFSGSIAVTPADRTLRVLLVKNGSELLARLPVVPGLVPELTASVVDDDERLEIEGFIVGLQEQVVDTVARRHLLIQLIRKHLTDNKVAEAEEVLVALRALGNKESFLLTLGEREKITRPADLKVQKQVAKLIEDTRQVIQKYLDQADVDAVSAEVQAAPRAAPNS